MNKILLYFDSSFEKESSHIDTELNKVNLAVNNKLNFTAEFPSKFYPNNKKLQQDAKMYMKELFLWKQKNFSEYDGLVIIPSEDINLEGNYLWYSRGEVRNFTIVMSSYLYRKLIYHNITFLHYIFILISAFFARHFVSLEESHFKSLNCLNDFCANQSELLNILNNSDYICSKCHKNLSDSELYTITKIILDTFEKPEPPKVSKKDLPLKGRQEYFKRIVDNEKHFVIEVYMSKKTSNMSELYSNLNSLLKNTEARIDGYSLYFVEGGWRHEFDENLTEDQRRDLNKVIDIVDKYKEQDIVREPFRDLIRPIRRTKKDIFAVYEEGSIVLRFLVKAGNKRALHDVLEEIKQLFISMGDTENSILYTVHELQEIGCFKKVSQSSE